MLLTKNGLKDLKRKSKIIDIEEYDISVKIQAMVLKNQLELERISKDSSEDFIPLMLMYCVVDEDGNQLFDSKEDVGQLSSGLCMKLFKECLALNKLDSKDLEELSKN